MVLHLIAYSWAKIGKVVVSQIARSGSKDSSMDNALVDGSLLSSGELFGGQPLSIQLQLEPKFSVVTEGSASFR